MEQTNNAVAVTTEQNRVTQQLLMDYLKGNNTKLSDNQLTQFLGIATAFNLNPFKREIYAVKYGDNFNVIVGYETYLKRAEEFPSYDGYETEIRGTGKDMSCTCTVYRKDRNHPTRHTVYLSEYSTGKSLWVSKPRMMLEKVALSTALRRAFPLEFGGMPYTSEEMGNLSDSEKLEQQGLTEVKAECYDTGKQKVFEGPAPESAPKAATTQDQKDSNWIAMMDELRERDPEIYDNYMRQHNVPDIAEIKGSKDRQKLYTDIKMSIDFAEKEADNG